MPSRDVLRHMPEIAEEAARSFARRAFQKRHPAILCVLRVLAPRRAVVYGGFAMNLLSPPSKRFYRDGEDLFDLDVRTARDKSLVAAIVDALRAEGFAAVSARPGLHEGTTKIYAAGVNVADVTRVGAAEEKFMLQECVLARYHGIDVLLDSPNRLLQGALLVLAKPAESDFRWEKMSRRMMALLASFRDAPSGTPPRIGKVSRADREFCRKHGGAVLWSSWWKVRGRQLVVCLVPAESYRSGPREIAGADPVTLDVAKILERVTGSLSYAKCVRVSSASEIYFATVENACICTAGDSVCPAFRILFDHARVAPGLRIRDTPSPLCAPDDLAARIFEALRGSREQDLAALLGATCVGEQEGVATVLERINGR